MLFCSRGRTNVLSLLFLILLVYTPFSEAEELSVQIKQFTGSQTRLVWVQDQAEGDDTLAQKNNMKIMAYDSEDGKGVRAMSDRIDNYYKPLFTPDGETILVSVRNKHTIYTINFDSGRMKKFASGVAVAVWQDPASGKNWVYALDGDGAEDHKLSHKSLVRYRLDKPGKKELVWNKTPLSWSNLDVSEDGQIIGGLFPWPFGSTLNTKTGELKRIGKGCWTSLSPGNDKILWIFDGTHRNLGFTDTLSGESWKTNINGAPGIDGYEVYHPRWSNHFNFFSLTGPYKEGEGGNKIGGGGKDVEIYLGRFDNSLKNVVDWFQLTKNKKADFYPDLWIRDGKTSYQNYKKADPAEENTAALPDLNWPSGLKKVLFFWQNLFESNQLGEDSLVGFSQNAVEPSGNSIFNRFGEMELRKGSFAAEYKENEALKIIRTENYFGMEMLYSPFQYGAVSGTIFSYGEKADGRIAMRQVNNGLELLIPEHVPVKLDTVFSKEKASYHFFLAIDNSVLQLYIDGKLIHKVDGLGASLEKIKSGHLAFGSSNLVGEGLSGAISHVVLFGKKPADKERAADVEIIRKQVAERQIVDRIELLGELTEKSVIPLPDSLGAYSRALTVNRYRVIDVVAGKYESDQILVASWAVLDREPVESAVSAEEGSQIRLSVEPFDSHPELEGERLMMDMFEPDLDLYYSVEK